MEKDKRSDLMVKKEELAKFLGVSIKKKLTKKEMEDEFRKAVLGKKKTWRREHIEPTFKSAFLDC